MEIGSPDLFSMNQRPFARSRPKPSQNFLMRRGLATDRFSIFIGFGDELTI
jgi:hypothetical protein